MADDTSSLINMDRLTTYHGLITNYIDDKTAVGDGAVEAVNTLIEDTSASGKQLLAESITNKGVAIDRTATYPEMAAAIDSIKTGSGTATPDQVLQGATFTNSSGEELTGTIPVVDITSPVTPGVYDITLINGNSYINNQVVIKGDSKLAGGNIRSGSSIFGINGEFTADATAVAANILTGKTAGINGTMVTGTMPNIGSITKSLNCGESYTIDGGFHDGTGKITAASLASQTRATAAAADILSGKTAWVNGSQVTGSIASLAAKTYTPGTSNQTIAAGQYLSGAQTIAGSSNLVAGNIKSGVKIFNVTGSLAGLDTGTLKKATLRLTNSSTSNTRKTGSKTVDGRIVCVNYTNNDTEIVYCSNGCIWFPGFGYYRGGVNVTPTWHSSTTVTNFTPDPDSSYPPYFTVNGYTLTANIRVPSQDSKLIIIFYLA